MAFMHITGTQPFKAPRRSRGVALRWVTLVAVWLPLIGGAGLSAAVADAVQAVGRFSDQTTSREHCSGHTVDIWRAPDGLLGLLTYCNGLIDRRAVGRLEEIMFDAGNGRLAFTVRLSVGMNYLGGGVERPSKDVWRFNGKLQTGALAGVLLKSDEGYPGGSPQRASITLKKTKAALKNYADAALWRKDADELLRLYGPKGP